MVEVANASSMPSPCEVVIAGSGVVDEDIDVVVRPANCRCQTQNIAPNRQVGANIVDGRPRSSRTQLTGYPHTCPLVPPDQNQRLVWRRQHVRRSSANA